MERSLSAYSTPPRIKSSNLHLFLRVVDRVSSGHRGRRSSANASLWCEHVAMSTAMAVIRARAPLTSLTIRQCRYALGLSQSSFAAKLGIARDVPHVGFGTTSSPARDSHPSQRAGSSPRPGGAAPARYGGPPDQCARADAACRCQGWSTPGCLRHTNDLSSFAGARDVGRCRNLLALVFQQGRVAEGSARTFELESDSA